MPGLAPSSVARSHVGCVRKRNEDRVLDRPQAALWAVADGMGGHAGGAAAAARVIDSLSAVTHGVSGPAFLIDISSALQAANRALHADAASPCGATIVALFIHEGHHVCLWAGDSRAYRLRDGALLRLSRDHSVVQDMVDRNMLSEAERNHHPRRKIGRAHV